MIRIFLKYILNNLWREYSRDKDVLYAQKPISGSVLSAEGFLLWLRGKHPVIEALSEGNDGEEV